MIGSIQVLVFVVENLPMIVIALPLPLALILASRYHPLYTRKIPKKSILTIGKWGKVTNCWEKR